MASISNGLVLLAFLFFFVELIAIVSLDDWPLHVGVKVLDARVPLKAAAGLDPSAPVLRGFKVRALSKSEYLLRPVSFWEKEPSAEPLVMGIARLSQTEDTWHIQAYHPLGPWVAWASFTPFAVEAGLESGY